MPRVDPDLALFEEYLPINPRPFVRHTLGAVVTGQRDKVRRLAWTLINTAVGSKAQVAVYQVEDRGLGTLQGLLQGYEDEGLLGFDLCERISGDLPVILGCAFERIGELDMDEAWKNLYDEWNTSARSATD